MENAPELQKTIINDVDVSEYVMNWSTNSVYKDAIGEAEIVLINNVRSILSINKLDTPGRKVTIQRGVDNPDEEWVFRGEIIDVETDNGKYVIKCANKYYEAVRSEATISYDINIDEQEGKGNLIFEDLITRFTSLDVTTEDTPDNMRITKFVCNHADVFERAEKIVEAYNWQHYYDNELDLVVFEPRGNKKASEVLEVGVNIVNAPKWKYSKEKMINELTLKGAEQNVQRTIFANGDDTEGQRVIFPETPTSVKVYVGSGSYDPEGDGTKPSNNESNLKRGGKRGSTSGTFDYEYDDDSKVKTLYFKKASEDQPSFTPPNGTNNIEVQYTYKLPTPVIDKRPSSISDYGLHKRTHTRNDLKNIDDAELYVQTTLDFFEQPMISTTLIVSYVPNLKIGNRYRVIDQFEEIDEDLIITEIKKSFPFKGDEIVVGDEVLRVDEWETRTMDRIKRLEEAQGESQDLLLHIVKNKREKRAERRYFKLQTKSVAGETGIYGHPIFGRYGTAKYGSVAESSFILGSETFGILGQQSLGESEVQEWQTIRLQQGENIYKELLYDNLFFDEDRSSPEVQWTSDNIVINPGDTLYTKTIELNSGRTSFSFRFGEVLKRDNLLVEVTYNNNNWIEVDEYDSFIDFPTPSTDIRIRITNIYED